MLGMLPPSRMYSGLRPFLTGVGGAVLETEEDEEWLEMLLTEIDDFRRGIGGGVVLPEPELMTGDEEVDVCVDDRAREV